MGQTDFRSRNQRHRAPLWTPRAIFMLVAVALCLGTAVACDAGPQRGTAGTVAVQIDLPAGTKNLETTILAGSTVLDAMRSLRESGQLKYAVTQGDEDSDPTKVLLGSFEGVENQVPDGPFWVYTVNGRVAPLGVGSQPLSGGDRLRWCYLPYEERESCATEIN